MSQAENVINADRASRYLAELAVPRMVGTETEQKTADRIEEHFRSLGLEVQREQFEFGSMRKLVRKTLTILLPASLFISLFLLRPAPLLSFLWAAAIVGLFSYMTRNPSKISWLGHGWGRKTRSQNIIAVKQPEQEERAHLILGAHYDSLSLTRCIYPDNYIMELFMLPVFFVSLGLLALIGIFGLVSSVSGLALAPIAFTVFFWLFVVLSFFFVTYLIPGEGNESAGASDNASGVAVLMELANVLKPQSLRHLKLSLVGFGAEEMGLLGSNHHYHARREQWAASKTYVISVDMPAGKGKFGYNAKYGIPPRKTDTYLNGLIREAANQLGVKCEEVGLTPGSGSDHMPFLERGVPGAFICALSKESVKSIHTSKDDLSAVDYDHLRDSCRLIHRLILNMDKSL